MAGLAAAAENQDPVALRNLAMVELLYGSGIRVGELTGLDVDDVNRERRTVSVVGKGNKERLIPFGSELQKALRLYAERRDAETPSDSQAFFVGDDGQRMTSQQVRQIVQHHLSRVTTMKKRSPHVLRHTFATAMLNNEAGIESVKKLLGHSKLSTTEIYTHTTFEQLRRAYAKAHPREV
jgi:integrase/recombinase XerC